MNMVQIEDYVFEKSPFAPREASQISFSNSKEWIPIQNKISQQGSQYKILQQIEHNTNEQTQFSDFVCLTESQMKHKSKNYSFDHSEVRKGNFKQQIVLLCRFDSNEENQLKQSRKLHPNPVLQCIRSSRSQLTSIINPFNMLFPQSNNNLVQIQNHSFLYININASPILCSSFQSFKPISSFDWTQKYQSEMFCLNKFYRFLLNVMKPLHKLAQMLLISFNIGIQEIDAFFNDVLVLENIFYEEKSATFFLVLLQNRPEFTHHKINSPSKMLTKCQKIQEKDQHNFIQTFQKLLKKVSQIFWNKFISSSQNHKSIKIYDNFHTSFLQNFLASIIKGELTLDEAIQILESKQKRKSFINEKIQASVKKVEKDPKSMSVNYGTRIDYGQAELNGIKNRYELSSIPSGEVSQLNLFNQKLNKKRKSVHRKLTGKRNTIDVILEYSTQKDVPPGFESRSQEKKTRLFKHSKSSKSRQRKSVSFYTKQRNYDTISHSIEIHATKQVRNKIGIERNDNRQSNFSFIQSSQNNKKGSKTIEIGEMRNRNSISQLQNSEREFEQNNYSKQKSSSKQKLMNFLWSQAGPYEHPKKSSTQNIQPSYVKIQHKEHQISKTKNMSITIQPALNMDKRQSLAVSAKNRRYYHINNFISSINDQSIEALITNQKKLLRQEPKHSKSKEKDLLNRSQQKAFAIFNKEINQSCKPKENSGEMTTQNNSLNQMKETLNSSTGNQVASYLMKKNSNSKSRYDENLQPQEVQGKYLNKSKRNSGNKFSQFSPPKKHKSIHEMKLDLTSNFKGKMQENEEKIDDREFRQKFSLHLNRKSISSQSELNSMNVTISKQKSSNLEKPMKQVEKSQQIELKKPLKSPEIAVKQQNQQIKQEKKQNPVQISLKVNNEYLVSNDQTNMGQQVVPNSSKRLDRTEKGLINAAKKLNSKINNKNFNIEQVFAQQQMLAMQQAETRKLTQKLSKDQPKRKYSESKPNEEEKTRKFSSSSVKVQNENNNKALGIKQQQQLSLSRQRSFDDSINESHSNIQRNEELKEHFEELGDLISPIKPSSKNLIKDNPKQSKQSEPLQKSFSNRQSLKQKKQEIQVPKSSAKIQQVDKPTLKQNTVNSKSIKETQQITANKEASSIYEPVNQPKIIEKLDDVKIEQAVFIQRKHSVTSQPKPLQNPTENNKSKPNPTLTAQQTLPIKQVKQTLPKKPEITQEQEFQLEEIKFTPTKPRIPQKPHLNQVKTQKPLQKDPPQTQSKPVPSTLSKPPLPHQQNPKPHSQQVPQQRVPQQIPASPANSSKKNSKEGKRQATVESVASSFGPHKSVKKIVEEYVFMVNKIGEAVAKTPKIAKKVQAVTDWYVGAYFLYKRFLYERKKMEKYLKEGTPKLTRYDQEINPNKWKEYLKSAERQTLMSKVSEENINIAKSIQRMQVKLLSKNIPQSIKQHAAISQRTSRQSVIAVDAVIDEFDCLVEKGMLKDEDIAAHCTEMFNACLIIAELDQLVEDIVPVSEFSKSKRTPEELQMIAQDLYDLYHDE